MLRHADMEIHVLLERKSQSKVGSKQEYYKAVHEAYTTQYLEALGIEPKDEHRRMVARQAPLGDCDIEATWDDHAGRTAVASHLRILQPIISRGIASVATDTKAYRDERPGIQGSISVATPEPPSLSSLFQATAGALHGGGTGWGSMDPFQQDFLRASKALDDKLDIGADVKLIEEMEKVRRVARGDDSRETENAQSHKWGLEGVNELGNLKRKFILPFAMERPSGDTSEKGSQFVPWQSPELREACDIQAPAHLAEDLKRPPQVTLPEILAEATEYAERKLPLELLTTRTDLAIFSVARESLYSSEMVRLIGLVSHLLYWTVCAHLHPPSEHLRPATRHSLVITIQAIWSGLVEPAKQKIGRRGADSVACFLIPVHMLATKRGVEQVFVSHYPLVFKDLDEGSRLTLALIDQLNVLMMSVCDPDCAFASFGALDSSVEAIRLWRKNAIRQVKLGLSPACRILGREFRTTPMMMLLLNSDGKGPGNAKTRMLLQKSSSDTLLAAVTGASLAPEGAPGCRRSPKASLFNSKVRPSLDGNHRSLLYNATYKRLAMSGHQLVSGGAASSLSSGIQA